MSTEPTPYQQELIRDAYTLMRGEGVTTFAHLPRQAGKTSAHRAWLIEAGYSEDDIKHAEWVAENLRNYRMFSKSLTNSNSEDNPSE